MSANCSARSSRRLAKTSGSAAKEFFDAARKAFILVCDAPGSLKDQDLESGSNQAALATMEAQLPELKKVEAQAQSIVDVDADERQSEVAWVRYHTARVLYDLGMFHWNAEGGVAADWLLRGASVARLAARAAGLCWGEHEDCRLPVVLHAECLYDAAHHFSIEGASERALECYEGAEEAMAKGSVSGGEGFREGRKMHRALCAKMEEECMVPQRGRAGSAGKRSHGSAFGGSAASSSSSSSRSGGGGGGGGGEGGGGGRSGGGGEGGYSGGGGSGGGGGAGGTAATQSVVGPPVPLALPVLAAAAAPAAPTAHLTLTLVGIEQLLGLPHTDNAGNNLTVPERLAQVEHSLQLFGDEYEEVEGYLPRLERLRHAMKDFVV